MQQPEQSTTYEEDRISHAIRRINGILERCKSGSSPEEFYQTMLEVMITLDEGIVESRNMRRAYEKMTRRVEIMEGMLSLMLKVRPELTEIAGVQNAP